MKTRVRTTSKFIVKPENKVVVCNMSVDMQLLVNDFGEFIVTAKARCNSDDTFDEATGKKIAESRAKSKAFKTAKNVWDCIAKGFVENAKMAEVMTKNCAAVEEIEVNHVKKLSE